jgi:hypothetical protein
VRVTYPAVVIVPADTVKVTDDAPAGAGSEAGRVNVELLSEIATTAPPVGAGWFRLTVQVMAPPESTFVEVQVNAETSIGPSRLKVVFLEAPFRVAVTVADWVVVTEPTVAVKAAEMLLAGTVKVVGMATTELLAERPTVLPPIGAASFRVTVQVVVAPELTLVGLHVSPETTAGSTRLRLVVSRVPLRVAVIVALWFAGNAPAVAMKLAELAPAATATVAGIDSRALLSDNATLAPDETAFRPTVQVAEAPEDRVPGLQLKDVRLTGAAAEIVPPVAVVGIAVPAAEVLSALVTPIVVLADTVTVSTTTTPLPMTFAFRPLELRPVRKHM